MKTFKSHKEKKKKPGEFKKSQKRHQNIQHNRDQLKLLREGTIEQASLFILDPDGFKRVTIEPMQNKHWRSGTIVVYLHDHGKKSRLRTGYLIDKDGLKICEQTGQGHTKEEDIFGAVINVEMLKPKE